MRCQIREILLGFFFPRRCPICDGVHKTGQNGICSSCRGELEYLEGPRCKRCSKPLEGEEQEFCLDCQGKEGFLEYGFALWTYDSAMQESMGRFKYHGRREYALCYAQEMYHQYGSWLHHFENPVFIPVPIHFRRYQKRGYNQAALIARELAKLSGIPVWEDFLIRCQDTLPQKELSDQERENNVKNAFQITGKNYAEELNQFPECVILLDDIYTTGSTLESCSRVLREAGVQKIYFMCVCIGKGF